MANSRAERAQAREDKRVAKHIKETTHRQEHLNKKVREEQIRRSKEAEHNVNQRITHHVDETLDKILYGESTVKYDHYHSKALQQY